MTTTTDMHGYINATNFSDVWHNQSSAYDNASDVSNSTLDHSYFQQPSRVAYYSLMTSISTAGIVGNSLVIYVIMTRQGMRTVSNLLLVNLAVADLIVLITFLASSVVNLVRASTNLNSGSYFSVQYITIYIFYLSVYVSVYTLTLIAVVRYLVVAYPHKSKRFVARKPVGVILAVIWTGSFIFGTFKVSWFSIASPCYVRSVRFFTVFAYVLPLSVIATLSILTFRRLKQPLGISGSEGQNRNKKKAARLLVIIVVVFAVSWLPCHIYWILWYALLCTGHYISLSSWNIAAMFAQCVALSNSCVNPIIYNLASAEFRQHFRDALCCRRQRRSATNRPIALV